MCDFVVLQLEGCHRRKCAGRTSTPRSTRGWLPRAAKGWRRTRTPGCPSAATRIKVSRRPSPTSHLTICFPSRRRHLKTARRIPSCQRRTQAARSTRAPWRTRWASLSCSSSTTTSKAVRWTWSPLRRTCRTESNSAKVVTMRIQHRACLIVITRRGLTPLVRIRTVYTTELMAPPVSTTWPAKARSLQINLATNPEPVPVRFRFNFFFVLFIFFSFLFFNVLENDRSYILNIQF